jgi:hypothetical protein
MLFPEAKLIYQQSRIPPDGCIQLPTDKFAFLGGREVARIGEASPRLWARIAGAFYLITIITGVFAEVFVRGAVIVRDDAAATATNNPCT